MSKIKVSKSFKRVSPPVLSAIGHNVNTKMTGNANFPSPDVALGTIKTAADKLDTLIQAAIKGSKASHDAVKAQVKVLNGLLDQEADYVNRIANGDTTIIESAGYQPTKGSSSKTPIPDQVVIKSITSTEAGTISIELLPLKNAKGIIAIAALHGGLGATVENDNTIIVNSATAASQVVMTFGTGHKLNIKGLNSAVKYDVTVFGYNAQGKGSNCLTTTVLVQ